MKVYSKSSEVVIKVIQLTITDYLRDALSKFYCSNWNLKFDSESESDWKHNNSGLKMIKYFFTKFSSFSNLQWNEINFLKNFICWWKQTAEYGLKIFKYIIEPTNETK